MYSLLIWLNNFSAKILNFKKQFLTNILQTFFYQLKY